VALTSPSPFSAGVGRTGTFITIDHVLEQVKKERSVNIPQVINKIRQQRMMMVQNVVGAVADPDRFLRFPLKPPFVCSLKIYYPQLAPRAQAA